MSATYILVSCRLCRHEFRVADRLRGRTVLCPHCGASVPIEAEKTVTSDPLVGRTIRGCRLEKRLGAGSMGAVYQAIYLKGQRPVAVKLLSSKAAADEAQVKRFRREAELCRSLNHPHIVKVFDQGEEKGAHFMIMELVGGTSLAELIARDGRLPWTTAAHIVRAISDALDHTKLNAVVHRDIKPGNILVQEDGTPKLLDLGLGKQLDNGGTVLTMQGACMGTPAYMPPEQIVDAGAVTHAADVYALGATFYHAVTGQLPYPGTNAGEIMTRLRNEALVPPGTLVADLPQGINDLICFMMEKRPENRPQNPRELIEALDEALQNPTVVIRRRRAVRRRKRHGSTWTPLLILGAVIIVAALAAIMILRQQGG